MTLTKADMQSSERVRELTWRRGWGTYLRTFAWTHTLHLTSRFMTSTATMEREFHRFRRIIARNAQGPVPFFYAVEEGVAGFPHIHGLIAGTGHLTTAQLEKRWRLGHTAVGVYDPRLVGCYYCTKDLDSEIDRYDFDFRHLPRLSDMAA